MKTINISWGLGNFKPEVSASIEDAMVDKVLECGILWLCQRAKGIDETLGGITRDANGKAKRVDGFKRSEVAYDSATARKLEKLFESLELPDDGGFVTSSVVVGEYEREAKALVYKREKAKLGEKESQGKLEDFLTDFCGYAGETHENGEFHPAALRACKVAIDKFLEEQMKLAGA